MKDWVKLCIAIFFFAFLVLVTSCGSSQIEVDPRLKKAGQDIQTETVDALIGVGVGQARRAIKEVRRVPGNIKKLEK